MWFTTSSGRIEIKMTKTQAKMASHQGQCDEDVLYLSKQPYIAKQLAKIDPKILANELREYGAWNDAELSDHAQNLQRIVWLAASDIMEGAN